MEQTLLVNWDQAKNLAKHHYDEPAMGYYLENGNWVPASRALGSQVYPANSDLFSGWVTSPLKTEVFNWFRKTYKLSGHCDLKSINHLGENYYYQIVNFADFIDESTTIKVDGFKSIEEAESACIDKLLQFIK